MLLAIDTSTNQTGLACYDEGGLLGECMWHSGRDHSAQLLPQLTLLLNHLRRPRDSISAVAVALGPGSWSGLRVGMSTAKGLTLANNLPLVGVGTLDALLYQHASPGVLVVPLIRLGRDRFATTFAGQADTALTALEPRMITLAEFDTEINGRAFFCGDIDIEVQETLRRTLGERACFPSPARNLKRPGYLAELAWHRLRDGRVDNRATLEPIYLGQPVRSHQ